mmetsp:Transcript_96633/g.268644  ORF Transcript_96633/g.268644 Transcript_96633/m.268644 type:complete len:236 (-) Transcript_96633:1029-1736(-)
MLRSGHRRLKQREHAQVRNRDHEGSVELEDLQRRAQVVAHAPQAFQGYGERERVEDAEVQRRRSHRTARELEREVSPLDLGIENRNENDHTANEVRDVGEHLVEGQVEVQEGDEACLVVVADVTIATADHQVPARDRKLQRGREVCRADQAQGLRMHSRARRDREALNLLPAVGQDLLEYLRTANPRKWHFFKPARPPIELQLEAGDGDKGREGHHGHEQRAERQRLGGSGLLHQ